MPVVTKNRALPHQTRFKEQDKYILFNYFIDRRIWEINKSDYGLSTSISNQCLTIHLDRRLESPWQTGYWRFSTELSTKVSKLLAEFISTTAKACKIGLMDLVRINGDHWYQTTVWGLSGRQGETVYPMVLIRRDRHELRLWEDVRLKVFCQGTVFGFRIYINNMTSRLILVHRIQDDL